MSVLDVFSGDAYNFVSLTDSINKAPYKPNVLGAMNLFEESGVTTKSVMVEEKHGMLSLIPTGARGSRGQNVGQKRTKNSRLFAIPYLEKSDEVIADDLVGLRDFGQAQANATIAGMVAEKLTQLKDDHELTWEWHRVGALKGTLLDADGSTVIYNWFTEFGITQHALSLDLSSVAATDCPAMRLANDIKRKMRKALGATTYRGIMALVGSTFMDELVCSSPDVRDAWDRYNQGQWKRTSWAEDEFEYGGIVWKEYAGEVGSTPMVAATKGHVFPVGAKGVFKRANAPGTFIEAVGTKGKQLYAKQARDKWNTKVDITTESCPLHYCTRPRCLMEITVTPKS